MFRVIDQNNVVKTLAATEGGSEYFGKRKSTENVPSHMGDTIGIIAVLAE